MKKPKLHVFGDSFSVSKDQFLNSKIYLDTLGKYAAPEDVVSWIDLVMNKLKTTDRYVHAHYGVSNEWIFKKLIEEIKNIPEEDYVIVQTTSAARHWFFEDRPHYSNISGIRSEYFTKEENNAIQTYLKYMQSDNLDNIIWTSMVYTFEYIRNVSKCKILVIPGWHNYPNVIGELNADVCDKEFENDAARDKFYGKYEYFDPRLNHMSANNHKILASKVVDWFQHNIPLNLTKDFETKIYTEK